jgi:hypothetical protein
LVVEQEAAAIIHTRRAQLATVADQVAAQVVTATVEPEQVAQARQGRDTQAAKVVGSIILVAVVEPVDRVSIQLL